MGKIRFLAVLSILCSVLAIGACMSPNDVGPGITTVTNASQYAMTVTSTAGAKVTCANVSFNPATKALTSTCSCEATCNGTSVTSTASCKVNSWNDATKVVNLHCGCDFDCKIDVAEPAMEPMTEPVADAGTEPVTELVTDAGVEPVVDAITEPAMEMTVDAGIEPMVEPVVDAGTEPVVDTQPEPVAEPIAEPVTEPVVDFAVDAGSEPVAEPVSEPAVDADTEPATEPVTEPVTDTAPDAGTEPATEPAMEPAAEPVVDAGPVDSAPEMVAEQPMEAPADTGIACGTGETAIGAMCICSDVLSYSGTKPWVWKWCNNSKGKTFVIFRGTNTILCNGKSMSQSTITGYHWRCLNGSACSSNYNNRSPVKSFVYNSKTFSYAELLPGWDKTKTEGYPLMETFSQEHRTSVFWPWCWRYGNVNDYINIQAVDWKFDSNPWQSHK